MRFGISRLPAGRPAAARDGFEGLSRGVEKWPKNLPKNPAFPKEIETRIILILSWLQRFCAFRYDDLPIMFIFT